MPQLGMQQQIRPGPARMGGPLNMNFRPPSFQQSPGQIAQRSPQVMAQGMMPQRNFNIDQLQSLMIAQQRYIANRSVHLDQSQTPNGQHVRPQILQRNQIQSDINTAAAFTALSNAQIAESKPQKVVEVPAADEEEGSDAENQPKRKKTSDSRSPTSKSNKKPANTKKPPPRKKTPTLSRQSKSNRRTSKPIVSETESEVEEDQLEDEESEEELEIDELESEAESDIDEIPEPPTKSRPPRTRPKRK